MRTFTFEENLEKIDELLKLSKSDVGFSLATAFLNTLDPKEKESMISALKIERSKNIEKGYYDDSVNYSNFLGIKFTGEEIETTLRSCLSSHGHIENSVIRAEELFLEKKLTHEEVLNYLLTLSKEMKSLGGVEYFSKKLKLPVEKDVLEEILKQNIQWGFIEETQKITNLLDRTLTQKEKTALFKNVSYYGLKDALNVEQFCNKKVPDSFFLKERKEAIEKGKYNLALTLSKITNRKIKNVDLEQMLDKLIFNDHIAEDQKKELESLEKHFQNSKVLAKKELALKNSIEGGYLQRSLQRSKDLGRNLSIVEFKTIFKKSIQSLNVDMAKMTLEKMKEFYPKEVKMMEVL